MQNCLGLGRCSTLLTHSTGGSNLQAQRTTAKQGWSLHRDRRRCGTLALRAAAGSASTSQQLGGIKVPKSLADIDNGKILGFGAELNEAHPGFLDEDYKKRRVAITQAAREHVIGQPIPRVQYTAEETAVWGTVLAELRQLYPRHACSQFLDAFPRLGFREGEVPQLEDLSQVLRAATGWQIRPVAGLLHPRDFLNGLAFKTFHSTQYMRHPSRPSYTPEPDICHELLGHVPMLADPVFCDLVHTIGKASLGADEKLIWHLSKIYWYTVEFGVVREGSGIKGFGAGVLSSFGELQHMASGQAELLPFDPFAAQPKMSYKDGYQKRYFVLDSFQDAVTKLKDYCATVAPLPDELRGDARSA